MLDHRGNQLAKRESWSLLPCYDHGPGAAASQWRDSSGELLTDVEAVCTKDRTFHMDCPDHPHLGGFFLQTDPAQRFGEGKWQQMTVLRKPVVIAPGSVGSGEWVMMELNGDTVGWLLRLRRQSPDLIPSAASWWLDGAQTEMSCHMTRQRFGGPNAWRALLDERAGHKAVEDSRELTNGELHLHCWLLRAGYFS